MRGTARKWGEVEGMPRINPHASALGQDRQRLEQIKWLKQKGFKTAKEALDAGY